jgi:hypothetical protein
MMIRQYLWWCLLHSTALQGYDPRWQNNLPARYCELSPACNGTTSGKPADILFRWNVGTNGRDPLSVIPPAAA